MWRDLCQTRFAVEDGVLFLQACYRPNTISFAPPRSLNSPPGGILTPPTAWLPAIEEYCRENSLTPRLCPVSAALLEELRLIYPAARAAADPAWSDYLYNAEDITALAGRRYSGQRNHINKFRGLYENWRFEAVDESNLAQTREFFAAYAREHRRDDPAYEEGNIKAIEVLDNYAAYRQLGGVLFVGDKIVGAAFGEIVGDTLFVHTEKALTEYNGAYPMLVNQYARQYAAGPVRYINREEDDGVEGLRTSKQSYHPCALLEKYVVEWDAAGSAHV
jgi:hypothetical protein